MPLPKFSELSTTIQLVIVVAVGAIVWGLSEYMMLQPVKQSNQAKQTQRDQLEAANRPLRQYRDSVRALEADNRRLENQLANLRRIVPNENEVDNFIRLLQTEAATAGISLRRFTAKPVVTQQYYVEVPFEMELDGAFYEVLQFYDRLGRVERITNVSDLKMDGIQSARGATGRYNYGPNETVTAVCTVTTFFSREEQPGEESAAAAPAPGGRGAPPAASRPAATR
ncbi:MAG TPA: type 4a pilus biogenesis protein PilO [Terriglobia bacterium]|nr:type 4a pilus biogenesis protein PilO [Terriglobia bacterium]